MRERIVDVHATVEVDGSDARLWAARIPASDRRFGGMFAWGDSFDEAREGLAELVVVAIEGADGGCRPAPVAVRVFATSRKVFQAAALRDRVQ